MPVEGFFFFILPVKGQTVDSIKVHYTVWDWWLTWWFILKDIYSKLQSRLRTVVYFQCLPLAGGELSFICSLSLKFYCTIHEYWISFSISYSSFLLYSLKTIHCSVSAYCLLACSPSMIYLASAGCASNCPLETIMITTHYFATRVTAFFSVCSGHVQTPLGVQIQILLRQDSW